MSRKVGVILSYAMMILEVLSTLLLTPFLIRTFGQAEYGVYKLSIAITTYLLLFDLGIGNALIKFTSKYRIKGDKQSENQFIGLSSLFYFIVGSLAIVASIIIIILFPYIFSKGLTSEEISLGQRLVLISGINAALTMATAPFSNMLIAYEKFAVSRIASIVQISLRIGISFIVLNLGFKSVGITIVNLVLTVLCRSFFVLYSFFALKTRPTLKGITKPFVKEIVGYSSLILLQMIAFQINIFAGQILLGVLVVGASTIIAIYSVGTQIIQYYQSIGTAFTDIMMPGVVKMIETNDSSDAILEEMVRVGRFILMVLGIVLVIFAIYGNQFITLWAGEENRDAYYVSIILMPAYLLILIQSIGNQILWAKNMHKEQSIIKLCIVLLSIGTTIALIYWKPLIGATIGTLIALVLGDIILSNIIFKTKLKVRIGKLFWGYFKGIVPCLLISGAAGYGFSFLKLEGWGGLLLNIVFTLFVYMVLMAIFGLNKYEKSFFKTTIKNIFTRKKATK